MTGATAGAMTATPMDYELEKAHRAYMQDLVEKGHGGYLYSPLVKTKPYFIDLAHFREMQVNSGDDLLNAIMGMMRIAGIDLTDCEKISIDIDMEDKRVQVSGMRRQETRYEIPPQYRLTAAEIAQQQMQQMADMLRPVQEEMARRMANVGIDQQMINELLVQLPKKP